MKRILANSILFAFTILLSLPAQAAPDFVTYSGRLSDGTGMGQSALMTLTFGIWDAGTGGTSHWEATFENVAVEDGYFSVILGEGEDPVTLEAKTATEAFQALDDAWLAVKIGDDPVLSPRQPIGSVPYAAQAQSLQGLNLNGLDGRFVNEGQERAIGSEMLAENLEIGGNLGVGGDLNIGGEFIQNGVPLRIGTYTNHFIATSGSDENGNGTAGNPWRTIQFAVNQIPQIVNATVNIYIAPGIYQESVLIAGFIGSGTIRLFGQGDNPSDVRLLSPGGTAIRVERCMIPIILQKIEFGGTELMEYAVQVEQSQFVSASFLTFRNAENGMWVGHGRGWASDIECYDCGTCIGAHWMSQVGCNRVGGSGNEKGFNSTYASIISVQGGGVPLVEATTSHICYQAFITGILDCN